MADFPAIKALIHEVGINPMGLDWRRFIVAVTDKDQLVGCGQVKPHRDGSRELASIAVVPAWRGSGVARAIIQRLLADYPPPLYLTCRASLGPFYERFGFRVASPAELPPYFRRISFIAGTLKKSGLIKEDLLVMVL
jgi:N-acetylglutamate synthase-like GNAT family acetyltransferase